MTARHAHPIPAEDWLTLGDLAKLLGISPRTAQKYARAGLLRRFEHGVPAGGRRAYSRELVLREVDDYLGSPRRGGREPITADSRDPRG